MTFFSWDYLKPSLTEACLHMTSSRPEVFKLQAVMTSYVNKPQYVNI